MDSWTVAALVVAGLGALLIVGGFLTVIGAGIVHRTGVGWGIICLIVGILLFVLAPMLIPDVLENAKSVEWANRLYAWQAYVGWGKIVIGALVLVTIYFANSPGYTLDFWTGIASGASRRQPAAIVILSIGGLGLLIWGIVDVNSDRKLKKVTSEFSRVVKMAGDAGLITSEDPLGFKIRAKEEGIDLEPWAGKVKAAFEASSKAKLEEVKVTAINIISLDRLEVTHIAVEFNAKKVTTVPKAGGKSDEVREDFNGHYVTLKWTGNPDETKAFMESWKELFVSRNMVLGQAPPPSPTGPTATSTTSSGLPLAPVAPAKP